MTRALLIRELKLTLQTHDSLNPKLWHNEKLIPEIWISLNKIAKLWAEFAKIPKKAIKDIIITGGNANYNYTRFSDIDLHLLVDKKSIPCEGLLDDYLQSKKELWSNTHNIRIKGHPVELYAQDHTDSFKQGQGVYSLSSNKWLQRPTLQKINSKDKIVSQKVKDLMNQIDSLVNSKSDDLDAFRKLKSRIKGMRVSGIQKAGEFSPENLVFKELRNRGYLQKMNNYMRTLHDKSLSL